MLGVTILRLVYLAFFCPYTLTEDEAHYWEWSRRPGWSYYSKGPGVAWSLAASRAVFGDTEFAVRFPAAIFGAIGALAIARLARDVGGGASAALYAAACSLLTPAFQLGGILMTVDMPYVALWALACVAAWAAVGRGSRTAWVWFGLAIGVGFLFKYTILLLLPGVLLFALLAGDRAPAWRRRIPAIGLGAVAFGVCSLPVLIWNAMHGWPTISHLLGHAGLPGGDMPSGPRELRPAAWMLGYLGSQLALIGPVLILMAMATVAAVHRRRIDGDAWRGKLFLICCGAPILLGYTLLALGTRVEGNWPIAGYVSLFALAGWAVAEPIATGGQRVAWRVSLVTGVVLGLAALRLDWVAALPPTRGLERALAEAGVIPPGTRLVPLGRLTGARAMAGDVAALGETLRSRTGLEPVYIAEHYGRAGLLAFYLPGRPVVYCSSSQRQEGRRTQYDYWPDTDLGDGALLGRPAVLVGSKLSRWSVAFDTVEAVGRLPNETKKDRQTFLGLGYRGFGGGLEAQTGFVGGRDGGSGR